MDRKYIYIIQVRVPFYCEIRIREGVRNSFSELFIVFVRLYITCKQILRQYIKIIL